MKTKIILLISVLILTLTLSGCSRERNTQYDAFAQCLTDSGVKMYGAYWCPHCQAQKEMFGDSWDLVEYIECSLPRRAGQTAVCTQAGIESYPTWEFADGSRRTGEIPLSELSAISGCDL